MPKMGMASFMCLCSVCSMKPSPPSAMIASAVSAGTVPYRCVRRFSADCASGTSLAVNASLSNLLAGFAMMGTVWGLDCEA